MQLHLNIAEKPQKEFKPREYQIEFIKSLYRLFNQGIKKVLGVAPTGAGKTFIASLIIKDAVSRGRSILFLIHRDVLAEQTAETLRAIGVDCGFIMGSKKANPDAKVQVASYQTLVRREIPDFDLIFYDEAHLTAFSTVGKKLLKRDCWHVGLTATPWRLKKTEGMGDLFESLIHTPLPYQLMEMGYLVKPRYFTLPGADLSGVKITAGDYNTGDLGTVCNQSEVIESLVDNWLNIATGKRTIVFAVNVSHAKAIAEHFNQKGIVAKAVYGDMPLKDREVIYQEIKDNTTQVIASCEALCLDSQTEILTNKGFVSMNNMTYEHKIANWDNGSIFFKEPSNIVIRKRKQDENMVIFHSEHLDIRVTEDHQMITQSLNCKIKKQSAKLLVGKTTRIPVSGFAEPFDYEWEQETRKSNLSRAISATAYNLRNKNHYEWNESFIEAEKRCLRRFALQYKQPNELTVAECKFIGFWLADGSKDTKNKGGYEWKMASTAKDVGVVDKVNQLLYECNINAKIQVSRPNNCKHDLVVWRLKRGTFDNGGIYHLEKYLDKNIGDWLWALNQEQFDAFIYGYWLGDGDHKTHGNHDENKSYRISCKNMNTLNKIQAVATCRGYTSKIYTPTDTRRTNVLTIKKQSHSTVGAINGTYPYYDSENKDELVWCVTTESKNIIIRRNYCISVTGNCEGFDVPSIECVCLARPTKSKAKYFQQTGRGLRISPNKSECLILDQAGLIKEFGLIEDLTFVSPINGKEKKPCTTFCEGCGCGVLPGMRFCPRCAEKQLKIKNLPIGEMKELIVASGKKRQYDFYQLRLKRAFYNNHSPGKAYYEFQTHYNEKPNEKWALGAVFGDNPTLENKIQYFNYLNRIAVVQGKSEKWIKFMYWLQFGEKCEFEVRDSLQTKELLGMF